MSFASARKEQFAEQMRRHPTPAEARVWGWLQQRRLDGRRWQRQVVLHGYIVDFYCPDLDLILELQGSIHYRPDIVKHDFTRHAVLTRHGHRVVYLRNAVSRLLLANILKVKLPPRQQPQRRHRDRKTRGRVLSPADKALKVRRALEAAGLSPSVPADGQVATRFRRREAPGALVSASAHEPMRDAGHPRQPEGEWTAAAQPRQRSGAPRL